jgi:hypothetical protein
MSGALVAVIIRPSFDVLLDLFAVFAARSGTSARPICGPTSASRTAVGRGGDGAGLVVPTRSAGWHNGPRPTASRGRRMPRSDLGSDDSLAGVTSVEFRFDRTLRQPGSRLLIGVRTSSVAWWRVVRSSRRTGRVTRRLSSEGGSHQGRVGSGYERPPITRCATPSSISADVVRRCPGVGGVRRGRRALR